ncbi:MAG: ribosome recycling factor [Actinobacteria bacterium]|nr:ribosome recycling factor [Actinomycetota bacterium]
MSPDEILADADHRMDVAVEMTQEGFAGIRTGRANPQLLHNLRVEYYGQPTPLQQLASFSVPEPRMLVINPFDKGATSDIERAIRESDLGLNPSTDGQIIRCIFPELTEERRREYIKLAKARAEEGRVAVRNVRRHARDALQQLEDDGTVGADEHERYAKRLEELTAQHVNRIDQLLESKERELLEV